MKTTWKSLLKVGWSFILIAAMLFALTGCSLPDEKVVRIYNWGDYIDETVIDQFEEETGYTVIDSLFETNEQMYTDIVNGGGKYDVLFPSDYMIERMISEDLLAEINFENVPNYSYIDDEYRNLSYDPENKYSIPYTWGTMGILYNTTMVSEPPTSWTALFDEQYDNSIFMLNSARDSIGITLMMLGYDINSVDDAELEEARQALIDQSDLVLAYLVDDYKGKMIAGEAALALAWQGDAVLCIGENEDLAYVIPEEGSNIFVDALCIPKNAPNKEGAEAFINFLCRPDIAAKNAYYIGYSSPSIEAREAMETLDEESAGSGSNPIAYPDITQYKLYFFSSLGDKNKIYDRIWNEIINSQQG